MIIFVVVVVVIVVVRISRVKSGTQCWEGVVGIMSREHRELQFRVRVC